MAMDFRRSETRQFDNTVKKLPSTDQANASEVATTNRQALARFKAIVIDPDESRRAFAATALTAFEPGFDVVSGAFMVTFLTDNRSHEGN